MTALQSIISLFIVSILVVVSVSAQSNLTGQRNIDHEILVQLRPGASPDALLTQINSTRTASASWGRVVAASLNIHLLRFDPNQWERSMLMDWLLAKRSVEEVQANRLIAPRNEPNDPDLLLQWGVSRIGALDVWSASTGGVTALGDTIVVAVVDSGFEPEHEDLAPSLWVNHAEIPGDNIDNDGNGLVDDVAGWDFSTNSGELRFGDHGLSVAGILGAKGDNNLGVAGVSWNTKLLLLSINNTAEVVSAYEYVLEMRRRYNESNGAEGAFVVATNASFGLPDPIFCSEEPIWGGMYDLMGAEGILTGAGTTNDDLNVDVEGDMPTTCESDFIITVMNSTEEEIKYFSTGYGEVSIDMAAPGQGSYTLAPFDRYREFGGNSAAAPHLTGAIALLYGLPCEVIAANALTNPEETALQIRAALLDGVDPFEAYQPFTATGGRLNIAKSMSILNQECGGTTGPLGIMELQPNPASECVDILYETPDEETYQLSIYNAVGQLMYQEMVTPMPFAAKRIRVPVLNWAEGVYFVAFQRDGDRVVRPMLIARHN